MKRRNFRAARRRSARLPCKIFRCSTCCVTGSGRRRSRSWPGMHGTIPTAAVGHRDSPRTSDRLTRSKRFGTGCRSSCSGSTRSASSNGRHCPTAPRCLTAVRCPRAAIGAPRRTCPRGSGWTRSNAKSPRTSRAYPGLALVGAGQHAAGQHMSAHRGQQSLGGSDTVRDGLVDREYVPSTGITRRFRRRAWRRRRSAAGRRVRPAGNPAPPAWA